MTVCLCKSVQNVKFADDTTSIGLITGNESDNRREVSTFFEMYPKNKGNSVCFSTEDKCN